MGSTLCVRCGAILIPSSYCDICDDVLWFRCSSCSMMTDARIHTFCQIANVAEGNINRKLDSQELLIELLIEPNSSQIVMNNGYLNNYCNIQNLLNDEIKHSSIRLSSSFWFNIFEFVKLINRYWARLFNISNTNTSIA
jgi:hypothetical protein